MLCFLVIGAFVSRNVVGRKVAEQVKTVQGHAAATTLYHGCSSRLGRGCARFERRLAPTCSNSFLIPISRIRIARTARQSVIPARFAEPLTGRRLLHELVLEVRILWQQDFELTACSKYSASNLVIFVPAANFDLQWWLDSASTNVIQRAIEPLISICSVDQHPYRDLRNFDVAGPNF